MTTEMQNSSAEMPPSYTPASASTSPEDSTATVPAEDAVPRPRRASILPDDAKNMEPEMVTIYEVLGDEMVVLNVGGVQHKTYYTTLASKPGTRLFNIAYQRAAAASSDVQQVTELFFDHDPNVFASVLDYYRTGELHVPFNVCGVVIQRELTFWQIDENVIEKCCWDRYCSQVDTQRVLKSLDVRSEELRDETEQMKTLRGRKLLQMRLWRFFFRPSSSPYAKAYAGILMAFVLLSIIEFCMETQPGFYTELHTNSSHCKSDNSDNDIAITAPLKWMTWIDSLCSVFFVVDIVVCFMTSPNRRRYAKSLMTIINILSLIPTAMNIIVDYIDPERCFYRYRVLMEMFLVLRILRIGRLFQVLNNFKPMRILWIALRASQYELCVLLTVSTVATFFFSTLIYYAEGKRSRDSKFVSIPVGLWWSIITITTVGYGDMIPVTGLGFVVGAFCAVSGTILFALTIPVLSNNFAMLYSHARSRERGVHEENLFVQLFRSGRRSSTVPDSAKAARRFSQPQVEESEDVGRGSNINVTTDELSPIAAHQQTDLAEQESISTISQEDEVMLRGASGHVHGRWPRDQQAEPRDELSSSMMPVDELLPRAATGAVSGLRSRPASRAWHNALLPDELTEKISFILKPPPVADDLSTIDSETTIDMDDVMVSAKSSLTETHENNQPSNVNPQ